MSEVLRSDSTKVGYLKTLEKLEEQIIAAQAIVDDCAAALADQTRLLNEITAQYNNKNTLAQSVITQAKDKIIALKDKVIADGLHNATEIAQYTDSIDNMNVITGG